MRHRGYLLYRNLWKKTMRRGTFKRKATVPMKRGKLRKESKQSISKLQRDIWELCKQIVRITYKNSDGTWYCYTCGRLITEPKNAQTGHMLAKASVGAFLKYDLRILRIQDYFCNINLGGNGAVFIENMREREGHEYVNKILQDRQVSVKAYDHYLSILEEYKKKLLTLQQ